jgi:hypothetical protein
VSATPISGLTLDSSVVAAAHKKRGKYKNLGKAKNLIALKEAIKKLVMVSTYDYYYLIFYLCSFILCLIIPFLFCF